MYVHRYTDENSYQIIHYFNGGSRILQPDQHDYLAWIAAGNLPVIETAGRFLSVVDGALVVDPGKDAILFLEAKAAKIDAVSALRDSKIAEGILFQFPDARGTIQTRNQIDFRNIAGISSVGLALIVTQSLDTLVFRDMENVIHTLTGSQAVQMGMYVASHVQGIYSASWVHKDAIMKLQTMAALTAYDINAGW